MQAGSYAVRVGMQGHMLPSWPQALHVQPCASDASQCWLSGAVLQVQHQPVLSVVFIAFAHRGSHAKLLQTQGVRCCSPEADRCHGRQRADESSAAGRERLRRSRGKLG